MHLLWADGDLDGPSFGTRSRGTHATEQLVAACAAYNQARGDRFLEDWLAEHPMGSQHPTIAAYLTNGGTTAHQTRMDAIFSQGVPNSSLCMDAEDVNRWLNLYQQHTPEGWAQLAAGEFSGKCQEPRAFG